MDIERKLWTNDAAYYRDALTEDSLLVFPETGVVTRDTAVNAILEENALGRRWAEVHFHDVRTLRLADDAALLNYRVGARWENEQALTWALASSIYVQRGGLWKLTFHQRTPVEGLRPSFKEETWLTSTQSQTKRRFGDSLTIGWRRSGQRTSTR